MSTQTLTELPRIQKTGMDFESVVEEIQNIIADNPNWRNNWNEFRDSEAGAMLIELFAWITDNFTTRQDLLFNEMFIGTAQDDKDKIKHLKQIGYVPKMPHSAKVPIKITFSKETETNSISDKIVITKSNGNENLLSRPSSITSFTSSDINGVNGENIYWEILKMRDGKPEYLDEILLNPGSIEYYKNTEGEDLYAIQGKTKCEEFNISTKDGSFFTLKEKNIASDSIQVYIQDTYDKLLQVKSFISSEALDENNPIPYVVELNEDGSYNIRFASKDIAKDSRLIKAGKTIFVFYRTCNGEIGNVKPGIISTSLSCTSQNGKPFICQVTNEFPAVGGSNKENLNDAIRNGPLSLTTMNRAVTPDDYNIILRNNTNVYKAKTYTSSNQPEGFKDYYGRFINPQESFTFLMTNKNHKGVPTEKYNDFPWFTAIKEPRINEKYIFDKGKFNDKTEIKGSSYNLQVTENGGSELFFNNATVIDVGELFNSSLYVEDKENKQLKLKLNNEISKELFLDKVPFGIFSQNNLSSFLSMDNSKIVYNDNARFVSKDSINLDDPIDVKSSRYISFVMDNGAFEAKKIDLLNNEKDIENISNYYLKWSNPEHGEAPMGIEAKSKEMANYRDGIVEIINNSINNAAATYKEFSRHAGYSKQPFGLKKSNSDTIDMTKDNYFSLKFTTLNTEKTYIFNKPEASLSLNSFKDYLNKCFKDPITNNVRVYNSTSLNITTEEDKLFLSKYEANVFEFKDSFKPSNDSIFVMDSVEGVQPFKYDLYICSNEDTALNNFNYKYEGVEYNVENAIDVEDPINSIIDTENASTIRGLFQILLNAETSVNRSYENLPNVYPKCEYKDLAKIIGNDEDKRFAIISPLQGPISSLHFKSSSSSSEDFCKNILKIPFINNETESYKSFGQKKAYMIKKDPLFIQNIINGTPTNSYLDIKPGNVIFENSCIFSNYDFSNIYACYKVNSLDRIELGTSYHNFYSTGDKLKDDKLKSKIVGLLGQKVITTKLDNGKNIYSIDINKSNFNIKLSKEPQDTNSLFAIDDDLGAIPKDYVEIKSNLLNKACPIDNYDFNFKIDNKDSTIITINGLNNVTNGSEFIRLLNKGVEEAITNNRKGSPYIRDNFNSIFKLYYKNDERIIINSVSKYDGSISFLSSENIEIDKKFYKWLFGTNLTNKDFYKQHDYISQDNKISESEEEFYYCPTNDSALRFEFRKIVDGVSRGADYTIEMETALNPTTLKNDYRFFIKKENNSKFPDNYFYVHFVNDKSYDYDDKGLLVETDESIFQKYMSKAKISGTDITFLQPYFKTYDIEATVSYSSDFTSSSEIKSKIEKAINNLCGLDNAKIGGKITKSEINYVIRNCEGVTDLTINYLGFNSSKKSENEDLEIIQSPFYSIYCLHEITEDGRGLKLELRSV